MLCVLPFLLSLSAAPPGAGKMGLELDGVGDGSRCKPFIDAAITTRPYVKPGAETPAPVDAEGWPTTDAQTCVFDIRPFPAWNPPIDDPDGFQPDWSGTYRLSFIGAARLSVSPEVDRLLNVRYDPSTNSTTGVIEIPKGSGLLILTFRDTRRTPEGPVGTGFRNLRILRPGYPAAAREVFTREFLRALRPFSVLRYMDLLSTNHNPGYYGDTGHHALEWKDRKRLTDATQQDAGEKYGLAWEYVARLANETGKDAWINVPVAATESYIRNLATFLRETLRPNIHLYIEHSNEVWNFGFPQYIYNKLAAIDEVHRGGSPLNNDGNTDPEVWTHRRHAKRLHDIASIFNEVFGPSARERIRPVYASWLISPDAHYGDVLAWFEKTYGPPKNFFYAIAGAAYYNAERASTTASPEEVLAAMRQSSEANVTFHRRLKAIADHYGLRYAQYEVGPDTGGGKVENVANRIRANRLPAMRNLVFDDATRWFAMGGDLYMYFAAPGGYSRYGCWGLSEDINQLETPKWRAIYELTGTSAPHDNAAVHE